MKEARHGTLGCYVNRRCRCDACRAANTAYYREWSERRKAGKPSRRITGTGPAYKGWKRLTRDQVAFVCEQHGNSIDYNPAARAAFLYAAKLVREAGNPKDVVLTPHEYLQSATQTERSQ